MANAVKFCILFLTVMCAMKKGFAQGVTGYDPPRYDSETPDPDCAPGDCSQEASSAEGYSDFAPFAAAAFSVSPYSWVKRTPSVVPYKCNFVSAGTNKDRMLYVGRYTYNNITYPFAIHHYGKGGTESAIGMTGENLNEIVTVRNTTVEWLCSNNKVSWTRVSDYSPGTLKNLNPLVIGNFPNGDPIYACMSHSFFDIVKPCIGTVYQGNCRFPVAGIPTDTGKFTWWHTLELLTYG